jgi:hypothetical protein
MVKHQDTPRSIRLRGDEFITIDPRYWNADMDVTINVGLGTGSRDRDMVMLQQVLVNQLGLADRFMQAGATEQAIEMLPKVIRTMTKIAESAGLRNPDEFYPDNAEEIVKALKEKANQPPPPNPKIEEIQAQGQVAAQLEQVKGQTALQVEAEKNRLAVQQAQIDAQGAVVKNQAELEADLQTKAADRQNAIDIANVNAALELQKQERELAWKTWDAEQNRQLEREKMANSAHIASMKPQPQPSGKPAG